MFCVDCVVYPCMEQWNVIVRVGCLISGKEVSLFLLVMRLWKQHTEIDNLEK